MHGPHAARVVIGGLGRRSTSRCAWRQVPAREQAFAHDDFSWTSPDSINHPARDRSRGYPLHQGHCDWPPERTNEPTSEFFPKRRLNDEPTRYGGSPPSSHRLDPPCAPRVPHPDCGLSCPAFLRCIISTLPSVLAEGPDWVEGDLSGRRGRLSYGHEAGPASQALPSSAVKEMLPEPRAIEFPSHIPRPNPALPAVLVPAQGAVGPGRGILANRPTLSPSRPVASHHSRRLHI